MGKNICLLHAEAISSHELSRQSKRERKGEKERGRTEKERQ